MAKWIIDEDHTVAHFMVRHMMINDVQGQFNKVSGFIIFDSSDIANTSVEIKIEAASIFTGVEPRDNHLRSSDFFYVERYPHILFKSSKSEVAGNNRFKVFGDLTLHGVTWNYEFPGEFTVGKHIDLILNAEADLEK
jgi:polyisoprenoid-binding protein YceI